MLMILDIPLSELALDAAAVSERVSTAARRHCGRRATGLGVVNDRLLVFLEEGENDGDAYRFAPFEGLSGNEVIGELQSRYGAAFSTVGIFELGKVHWGLFRKEKS